MSETVHLGLPLIAASQSQKHVTHNEALALADTLVHLAVISRTLPAPPASPLDGDRYLIAAGATGEWAAHDDELAFYLDGSWRFAIPRAGWRLWSVAEEKLLVFDGSLWRDMSDIDELQNMELLGVNTTADALNRLAVASANVLFTHDGGDQRVKLNKNAAADTASFLFQNSFSGRAEMGLAGDDDFHFKVSPDGSAWTESFVIDKDDGAVSFALGAARKQIDKFTSSGSWTKPAWAKRVIVFAVSGGSGGGSGATRGAGVATGGGGGGAAGTMVEAEFAASDLAGSVAVTIGAGGSGGAAASGADANGNPGATGGLSQFGSYLKASLDSTAIGGGGTAAAGAAGVHSLSRDMPPGSGGGGAAGSGASSVNGGGKLASGGGGGGNITGADVASNGGASGFGALGSGFATQALGGTAPGGSGGIGAANTRFFLAGGDGGGGGAAATAANGGAGGNGGAPGGGGGGGGAARNGFSSGKGGDGGQGEVWVIALG